MGMHPKTRIVVADDHDLVLNGLETGFAGHDRYEIVDFCRNGEQLVRSVAIHQPDVVLTDLKMPVMTGLEAIASIHHSHPTVSIVVLTSFDNDHLILEALDAGAYSYVNKGMPVEKIFLAIEQTLQQRPYYCDSTSQRVLKMIANHHRFGSAERRRDLFNEVEKKVIVLFCQDKTVKEIADIIHLSDRTVERYKITILQKMEVKTVAGLVTYAVKNGMFNPDIL